MDNTRQSDELEIFKQSFIELCLRELREEMTGRLGECGDFPRTSAAIKRFENLVESFRKGDKGDCTVKYKVNKYYSIGEAIADLREQMGMSQMELGSRAHTSNRTISGIESGSHVGGLRTKTRINLASAFGLEGNERKDFMGLPVKSLPLDSGN